MAADIGGSAPSEFRQIAFERVLVYLLERPARKGDSRRSKKSPARVAQKVTSADEQAQLEGMLDKIDASNHGKIHDLNKALDLALCVLRVATTDLGMSGLTPSEIKTILTKKFRITKSVESIQMALKDAKKLVDRVPRGQGYEYSLMKAGEDYLTDVIGN